MHTKTTQLSCIGQGFFLHVFIPCAHHPDQGAPVVLPFQTQEQMEVLENLKQELASSKQELQIAQGSLDTCAQVGAASFTPLPYPPPALAFVLLSLSLCHRPAYGQPGPICDQCVVREMKVTG